MRISKSFSFEAAHRLQQHEGQCKRLHGHSYKIEVFVDGPNYQLELSSWPESGMLMDFGELSDWWHSIKETLDHRTILEASDPLANMLVSGGFDESVIIKPWPPTAENLAQSLKDSLTTWLFADRDRGGLTAHVRVWETATSWAEA